MGVRADYRDRLAAGELRGDPAQALVVDRLEHLSRALEQHEAHRNGLLAKLLNHGGAEMPKGLYLWGDVGRGKTMLMDAFFASVPVGRKQRVHFHAFMQDVHASLHRARQAHKADNAIAAVARDVAASARLLCLDEMQIADIADAMIVGRLFEQLFDLGVVVVTTSNIPPDDLYRDGLNRDLFLPFVRLIAGNLEVVKLDSATDYRLGRIRGLRTFITPLGPATNAEIEDRWEKLTDTRKGAPLTIELLGRRLLVPQAVRVAARFSFADLCEAPLGPADYLALIKFFRLIFIENIPALHAGDRDAARRFIMLIDTLYDARVRLVASSEMSPADIYDGKDHRQEFARAASRLEEMQSASWWGARIAET